MLPLASTRALREIHASIMPPTAVPAPTPMQSSVRGCAVAGVPVIQCAAPVETGLSAFGFGWYRVACVSCRPVSRVACAVSRVRGTFRDLISLPHCSQLQLPQRTGAGAGSPSYIQYHTPFNLRPSRRPSVESSFDACSCTRAWFAGFSCCQFPDQIPSNRRHQIAHPASAAIS